MNKKTYQKLFTVVAIVVFLSGCATSKDYTVEKGLEKQKESATVALEIKAIALGIGAQKGEGTINFQDQEYTFTLKGVDYGSISKMTIQTTGKVYHLKSLDDFEGIYFQARAALSVGDTGKGGIFLVNRHGVTIRLVSQEEKGFDLSLGRGGIKIKFKK
jgi:hypothetical protein